jgi:hypothetical protein
MKRMVPSFGTPADALIGGRHMAIKFAAIAGDSIAAVPNTIQAP